MNKGGYQIIDLKGRNLITDTPVKVEGIYDKIEGTTKALLFTGIVIDNKEYRDTYPIVGVIADYFRVFMYDRYFIINAEDEIILQ